MEAIGSLLEALRESALPTAVRESEWLFPAIETVHVLALILVVGSIGRLDLRLVGLGDRSQSVAGLTRALLPWTWSCFFVALVTGALMFSSEAVKYAANGFFLAKMALLVLAGINMLVFQLGSGRQLGQWTAATPLPRGARLAGGISLLTWVGVVVAGRWIGYTMH